MGILIRQTTGSKPTLTGLFTTGQGERGPRLDKSSNWKLECVGSGSFLVVLGLLWVKNKTKTKKPLEGFAQRGSMIWLVFQKAHSAAMLTTDDKGGRGEK